MSIIEVAKFAGVSKSTVSRVINRSPGVRPEVAKAVLETMDRMGYQPSARRPGPKPASRRGVRTGNVLLLMLGVSTPDLYRLPVFPSLVHGVESGAKESGLNLVLASLQPDGVLPAALSGGQVDGVLLLGKPEVLSAAAKARLQALASVGLMRGFAELGTTLDRVLYDNSAVGPMAAEYLLRRGHTRVAFFNVFPDHDAFESRRRDFAAAIDAGGGAQVLELVAEQRPEDLRAEVAVYDSLVARLVEAPQRPTGLFVPTDAQLPPLYQSLESRGIDPGRDIDVVSCDYEEQFLARLSSRPATVDINLQLVGRRGVQQLLWRLSNPNEKSRITILVGPVLIAGEESVG